MKAQIAAEFVLYSGIALMLVLTIITLIGSYYDQKKSDQGYYEATKLGRNLQKELIIADNVKIGFSKKISLPKNILGENYTINTYQSQIEIIYQDNSQFFNTPLLKGIFIKGDNNITTNETTIFIN